RDVDPPLDEDVADDRDGQGVAARRQAGKLEAAVGPRLHRLVRLDELHPGAGERRAGPRVDDRARERGRAPWGRRRREGRQKAEERHAEVDGARSGPIVPRGPPGVSIGAETTMTRLPVCSLVALVLIGSATGIDPLRAQSRATAANVPVIPHEAVPNFFKN